MAQKSEELVVKEVFGSAPLKLRRREGDFFSHEHKEKHHPKLFKSNKEFFPTIAKAAEESNKVLWRGNKPYRFCIYKKGPDVYLAFMVLDDQGKVSRIVNKNIGNDDFERWIDDVAVIEGLLIDETV
jgi:hypothetical protein